VRRCIESILDPWKHRLMAGVVRDRLTLLSAVCACALAFGSASLISEQAAAQAPNYGPTGPALGPTGPMPGELAPPNVPPPAGAPGSAPYRPANPEVVGPPNIPPPRPGETRVADVQFEGLKIVRRGQLPKLGTQPGEPYDPQVVEEDVRKLMKTRKFINALPVIKNTPQGPIVIFQVVERRVIQHITMVGNQGVLTSTLIGQTDLKIGDGMDPYSIKEARDKIESYYQEHGWDRPRVTILEGNKPGDTGATFLIDEGRARRVWYTKFVGNTIASSARLRTQIDSKPPILWLFKGDLSQKRVDEDVQKLTAYYRGLGFFQAKIGREITFDAKQNWATITFVINEGPRYKIRNVSVVGNDKIGTDAIMKDLKLNSGAWFNQGAMSHDVNLVRDLYGGRGYVFADIEPDPRLLEHGEMDLIYTIKEGSRYRVGKINVNILGDSTHTNARTIYNRLSVRPGDILDTRKLRSDERRLKASQIFAVDPTKAPKITFSPLDKQDPDKAVADRSDKRKRGATSGSLGASGTDSFRGQSPDGPADRDIWVSIDVSGELLPGAQGRADLDPMPEVALIRAPGREPIVRAQSPDAAAGSSAVYRAQAPSGGWTMQPTDPDSGMSVVRGPLSVAQASRPEAYEPVRVARYQAPSGPSYPNAYPSGAPAGPSSAPQYTYPAAPGQPNVYSPGAAYGPPGNVAPAGVGGSPQAAYYQAPGPGGVAPEQVAPGSPVQVVPGQPPYVTVEPWLPVDVFTNETQTGKLMVGVGVNSDAGLIGNVVIDEQNFDISRWPSSWEDFRNGTAFRGAGQRFRLEAAPGTLVQRYVISFQEPYLFDTPVSFSTSASYFTRIYQNWHEARTGGRFGLGYYFTPDLSGNVGFRIEEIRISDPSVPTPPELERALGDNHAYGFNVGFAHDTRDNPFLPTQGHLIRGGFEEVTGTFTYPQGTIEGRQYFKIAERPDGSGRHVLGIGSTVGFSGSDTPIYDEFFAGGFSTLRGFQFRGASPLDGNVEVGGNFEFLNTAEYLFPITADDALRGVAFVDFGTVERNTEIKWQDFRISPGLGLRISIPALGPAPIALDFAVPIHHAPGDREEIFSFFVGLAR
jgi:outer membrane protein insertion porin family